MSARECDDDELAWDDLVEDLETADEDGSFDELVDVLERMADRRGLSLEQLLNLVRRRTTSP